MFASLHIWGTCPVFQLKLKMSSMAALAFFLSCLIMSFVIWSGPGGLLVFRSSSASCNSFMLKGCSIHSGEGSSLCNFFHFIIDFVSSRVRYLESTCLLVVIMKQFAALQPVYICSSFSITIGADCLLSSFIARMRFHIFSILVHI